jgi:hypothetical protein
LSDGADEARLDEMAVQSLKFMRSKLA